MSTKRKGFLFAAAVLLAISPVVANAKPNPVRDTQTAMMVEGVTDQGWIAGRWIDTSGNVHWFLVNPFVPAVSDVLVPRPVKTQVWAVHMNRF